MAQVLLIALTVWILISGLDDVFIGLVGMLTRRSRPQRPTGQQLRETTERPIAIFIACWHEHRVIGQMLDRATTGIDYGNYEIFVGVYPNDQPTMRAVADAAERHPRVHMAVLPHSGPTSKGDCLNWTYQRLVEHEERSGVRFEVIVTHDAEDIVHPESLSLINWYSRDYQMVQIPVLALPTPPWKLTHGLYCDEFAEFQSTDIPVRTRLGGFLPSNGVGCGFERNALMSLAGTREGLIFDPANLTEDYENGFHLHAMGYRQIFVPISFVGGAPVATREYFPHKLQAAIRQRSRWVTGISLQGWELHGWRAPWLQCYWLWRDRKGLIGNLLSPFSNALICWFAFHGMGPAPRWMIPAFWAVGLVAIYQTSHRMAASAGVYGWGFACLVPLRMLWGNMVNFRATVGALRQYVGARLVGRPLSWRKTEHSFASHQVNRGGRPKLGELLVRMRYVSARDVENAVAKTSCLRLGERLVQMQKLSLEDLYHTLSLQSGIPCGAPQPNEVQVEAARELPAELLRHWKVLPYRVGLGQLHVATTEEPSDEMVLALANACNLDVRFRLVQPDDFAALVELANNKGNGPQVDRRRRSA